MGGKATAAKYAGGAFAAGDLKPITTLEDAKLALDEIRVAILTRRITYSEGASASKAVSEWVKTESAAATGRLVGELRAALEAKTEEIETLRKQLSAGGRMRAVM
jgi:hypothetical protein